MHYYLEQQTSKITFILSSPLHHHISLTDMTQGFKKWKESTTTSPSTRHLGHYKSFLVSDGKDNDTDHCSFNTRMVYAFNTIINATIESGHPLKRWLSSIVIMIENISNNPRINKLRIINIYEAEYTLIQTFVWSKLSTKHAEVTHTLGENAWRCRLGCSADNVALIDEFVNEVHRLTFQNLFKLQHDAKACFDPIIKSHAILSSRKFEIPGKIYQIHSATLRNTEYRVQTALGTSTNHYKHSESEPIYGNGQGVGSSEKTGFILVSLL